MIRFQLFRLLITSLIGILIAGLFRVQVLKGPHFYRLSEHNRIRLVSLMAPRGDIYDRNGILLAGSRPSYTVSAVPDDVTSEDLSLLSDILKLPLPEIKSRIDKGKKVPFMPVVLKRGVDIETLYQLEERRPELGGVLIQVEALRYYPFKSELAHLVGYVGKISKQELESDEEGRYEREDMIGRAGIERGIDATLRGENGGRQIEVDARGRESKVLSEREPKKGSDVTLTIDMRLQSRIEEIFAGERGTVGLLDLASGEILAWVNRPSFDPNAFVDPNKSEERLRYLKDPNLPMMDRGLRAVYPPGSLFKPVTALAALEKGKLTPQSTFFCNGVFRLRPGTRPFRCWQAKGHGPVNLTKALERSCNVFFYHLGRMLTPEEISDMARRLGLGEPLGVEVLSAKSIVPDQAWKKKRFKEKWYQGETISFAIGQGYLTLTPMELMRMVGTVALGHEMPALHFLKGREMPRKKVLLAEEDVQAVKRGMFQVVQSQFGTGQYARVPFMNVGGKTGTAQARSGGSHAWFGGFYPFEEPKVAFIVFVEHGKSGGMTAAKIANKVFVAWKETMDSPAPHPVTTPASPQMVQPVPTVQGAVSSVHVGQ